MRLKTAVLSTALASLLLAPVAFAAPAPAPSDSAHAQGSCHGNKEGKMLRKLARMERKLDRAVEQGRLTQAQAEQFKVEARQLRDAFESQRQASGGQLTDAQKQQFKQRKQELRERVKAAMKDSAPRDV